MSIERGSSTGVFVVIVVVAVAALQINEASAAKLCPPSSCGDISNISSPFRLKGDDSSCGRQELVCENNRTTLLISSSVKYYVKNITYYSDIFGEIQLVDADLDEHDYCSIPPNFFTRITYYDYSGSEYIYFMTCPEILPTLSPIYYLVDFSACINSSSSSSGYSQPYHYLYAVIGIYSPLDFPKSCNITVQYPMTTSEFDFKNLSISNVHQNLLLGITLDWYFFSNYKIPFAEVLIDVLLFFLVRVFYEIPGAICLGRWSSLFIGPGWYDYVALTIFSIVAWLLLRALIGILLLVSYLVYKYRRRHLSLDDSIENFLQSHNNLMPIRYSYSDIKKMTKCFKDKLGQGGYGSVFKAKLRSGHLVAIKLLSRSSITNGQDFINEVTTIGRIHHVNVVRLVGFCAEGSKRALVYDFMPNGSLDKFLFLKGENKIFLSWERMYKIALGVALGIEYLHRGCNMQILHFDIKPHNILLDENFVPKVSDFGLAKLYSTDDSIVSLTAARGTLGYIAPELFYKSIGGISYKADVYSFGMLLMEMVGRRKNIHATAEHSSQIYFPTWIYDRIHQGEYMELGDVTDELKTLVKKMTIVALWCIQMKPVDRPSMSNVLDMLEGEAELLQIPPKPSFYPPENPIEYQGASSSSSYLNEDYEASSSSYVDIKHN